MSFGCHSGTAVSLVQDLEAINTETLFCPQAEPCKIKLSLKFFGLVNVLIQPLSIAWYNDIYIYIIHQSLSGCPLNTWTPVAQEVLERFLWRQLEDLGLGPGRVLSGHVTFVGRPCRGCFVHHFSVVSMHRKGREFLISHQHDGESGSLARGIATASPISAEDSRSC